MSIRDAISNAPAKDQFPTLSEDVKSFPVREGEEPWTGAEVETLADDLIAENVRLSAEAHGSGPGALRAAAQLRRRRRGRPGRLWLVGPRA